MLQPILNLDKQLLLFLHSKGSIQFDFFWVFITNPNHWIPMENLILFGGFYKTGDRVQLGGIKGDVMDIGVLRTTVMEIGQWVDGDLYNGRIVLVANSFVFKEPVFNYSGDFPFLWDGIKIPIQKANN